MNNGEIMPEWTDKMSIDITNIPKEKMTEVSNAIGSVLLKAGLEFEYGGIGEGFSDNICGIEFEVVEG